MVKKFEGNGEIDSIRCGVFVYPEEVKSKKMRKILAFLPSFIIPSKSLLRQEILKTREKHEKTRPICSSKKQSTVTELASHLALHDLALLPLAHVQ